MNPIYDDKDLVDLIVARGLATHLDIERAARAASDPTPGRLALALLQRKVVERGPLQQVLQDLCRWQFKCRSCNERFVSLPRPTEERRVHCPHCGKKNLIPPAPPGAAGPTPSGRAVAHPGPMAPPQGARVPTERTEASDRPRAPVAPTERMPAGETDRAMALALPGTPLGAPLGSGSGLDEPLEVGRRFGRYFVIDELARGAMGVVYRARHEDVPDRIVALKVLQRDLAQDPDQVERFRREAQALARVDHANVVRVHDAGQVDGHPFFAMELIEGETLEEKIKDRALPFREAAALMAQIARGVAYLHAKKLLHRDLKLTNVLVDREGRPKITDFGLARALDRKTRLTVEGDRLGTPLYMAPEQMRGDREPDERADVWALGVMFFRLATKAYPFFARTQMELGVKVLAEQPGWPDDAPGDKDLHAVCEHVLEKEVEDRYPSAAAFASDLEALAAGAPVRARPLSAPRRLARTLARRPAVAAIAALALVAIPLAVAAFRAQHAALDLSGGADGAKRALEWKKLAEGARATSQRLRGRGAATSALDAAAAALAKVGPPPDLAGAPPDLRASVTTAVAQLADERAELALLRGEPTAARAALSASPPAEGAAAVERARVAALAALLGDHPEQVPAGVDAALDAWAHLALASRASRLAGELHAPPGTTRGATAWRHLIALVGAHERPPLATLDAMRGELAAIALDRSVKDATFASQVLGELELAAGRPAGAAHAFERGLDPGPATTAAAASTDERAVELARGPAIAEVTPGVPVALPRRTALLLGRARARARLLDGAVARTAAEAAVAATESSGLATCAALLLLADAHRTCFELDQARALEDKATAALVPVPDDARRDLLRRETFGARARTHLVAALGERGEKRASLLAEAASAAARARGSAESDGLAASIARLLDPERTSREDPLAQGLVADARAELAIGESIATHPDASQRAPSAEHLRRALRAALLAWERDPGSPLALAALARVRAATARLEPGIAGPDPGAVAGAAVLLASEPTGARALALVARGLVRVERDRAGAAQDLDEAAALVAKLDERPLERADDLLALHRVAASAFEAAGAPDRALVHRERAAKLADDEKLSPATVAVLHDEAARVARLAQQTTRADEHAAAAERARGAARRLEEDLVHIEQAVNDVRARTASFLAELPRDVLDKLGAGFATTLHEPLLYHFRNFARSLSSGQGRPRITDHCLACELDPELFRGFLLNWSNSDAVRGRIAENYESFAAEPERARTDRPPEDAGLDADLELLAACAYANRAAFFDRPLANVREGVLLAERVVRRRPTLRAAQQFHGRLLQAAGDGAEAVLALERARALPRPFHERARQIHGKPHLTRDEPIVLYLLIEATMTDGDLPRAAELVREGLPQRLRLPEWLRDRVRALPLKESERELLFQR